MIAFCTENNENDHLSSANFTEGNILLKERTETINNKIKLHILGVPVKKIRQLADKLENVATATHCNLRPPDSRSVPILLNYHVHDKA